MIDLLFSTFLIAAKPQVKVEPHEPKWVQINNDVIKTFYYDANSFRGRKNYRTVNVLVKSNIGDKDVDITMYIECKSKKRGMFTSLADTNVAKLNRRELKYPDPDSIGELMVNITCPKVIK